MSEKIIGNCSKHPGFNMVNCPMCEIEAQKKLNDIKYHAVEYAGYWVIQDSPFYGGRDILNAEDVGEEDAKNNALLIERLLNKIP